MRAVVINDFGDAGAFTVEDVPRPKIIDGELLVEVKAVGINPIDYVARSVGGPIRDKMEGNFPVILGWDIAGIVTESKSSAFNVGDKIFALSRFPELADGYAEIVSVPADQAVIAPVSLSFEEAAAVPLAALTAWQALVETANVQAGQRVLIQAAAGGVGHFAVQIAKLKGAYVIGSSSSANVDYLISIGVDETVDYTAKAVGEQISEVDVVLHALPPDIRESASWPCLKSGGLMISLTGPAPEEESSKYDATCIPVFVRPNSEQLAQIGKLIDDGAIKVALSKIYSLEEVGQAHRQLESRHTNGKVVIKI